MVNLIDRIATSHELHELAARFIVEMEHWEDDAEKHALIGYIAVRLSDLARTAIHRQDIWTLDAYVAAGDMTLQMIVGERKS